MSYEPVFEVTIKRSTDDDTESLFQGTQHECAIFMDAYICALRYHTEYLFDAKTVLPDFAFLASPLISRGNLWLNIVKRPDEMTYAHPLEA